MEAIDPLEKMPPIEIEIFAPETSIDLTEHVQAQNRVYFGDAKISFQPTVTRRSEEAKESPILKSIESSSVENVDLELESLDLTSTDVSLPKAINETIQDEELHFTVGLSLDTNPEKHGGWKEIEGLSVTQLITDDGVLQFHVDSASIGVDHRVRATFALENKPAIRLPVPLYSEGVIFQFKPIIDLNGLNVMISIRPVDKAVGVLASAIEFLNDTEATQILEVNGISKEDVLEIFAGKRRDPWAATAAAILITTLKELEALKSWAFRLESQTAYISDTAVVAAWAQIHDAGSTNSDEDLAELEVKILDHLILSRKRGAPTFVATQRLAMDLLSILATSAQKSSVRRLAKSEYERWSKRGKRRIRTGSYLAWEESEHKLMDGQLPKERYNILRKGHLTKNGFIN
ncbi:MAG: hypothetical protein AAF633_23050 [Chloroflexota bacterium]